jgi:hypothetical protein
MNINDFPYEILCQILHEVTKANVREGPTYTFGLQQAPLPPNLITFLATWYFNMVFITADGFAYVRAHQVLGIQSTITLGMSSITMESL